MRAIGMWRLGDAAVMGLVAFGVSAAWGQTPPPNYDFQFATVGNTGNAPIPDEGLTQGRGRVDYAYRISKLEITTGQWLEFVNTYSTRSNDMAWFGAPTYWGAGLDDNYSGPGVRWKLNDAPQSSMRPVFGITWREAAQYCNWLCNRKAPTLAAIANGAYDTSTFGGQFSTGYTDQATHNPNAEYWIPTLDEWLKAAHYDPNKNGDGVGGWWQSAGRTDTPLTPGLPGIGQTSAAYDGFEFGSLEAPTLVPLGAYADVTSAYGLWDCSGGTSEWTEDWLWGDQRQHRIIDGGKAGSPFWENRLFDTLTNFAAESPDSTFGYGFRIASSVPTPSSAMLAAAAASLIPRRRRIFTPWASSQGASKTA